ncbi:MAG: hypothetical protein VX460_00925 [Planctomycetota bacterium]|nr:hypothetical protein [Planctomycetota bacterium]
MLERRPAALLFVFTLAAPLSLAGQASPSDPVHRPALAPDGGPADQVVRADLRDDDVPGNAGTAYRRLRRRGAAARPALVEGLQVADWQERLLSAVLLAQLPTDELTADELDELIRTLVGHLSDNRIRGDARLAANALVVIGRPVQPHVRASAWHAEPQLADLCERLARTLDVDRKRLKAQRRSRGELERLCASLAWTGPGPAVAPPPARPLPDVAESLRRGLVDLGADDRRGNAYRAWLLFQSRADQAWRQRDHGRTTLAPPSKPEDPEGARLLQDVLHGALTDPDRQRRQLAGHVLMRADELPTRALLSVAIEALELDEFGSSSTVPAANADRAGVWLLDHLNEAGPELLAALEHSSHAVRLRAAAVLAQGKHPAHRTYVPLLIHHLANNDIEQDATLAGRSLSLLGPAARPWLDRQPVDAQQAAYFDLIRSAITRRETEPDARLPFSHGGMYGLELRQPR